MRSILAVCTVIVLFASPLLAETPPDSPEVAVGTGADTAVEEQPSAPPSQVQDSIVLANGKVRIGALFYTDFGVYFQTGFGPQFVTQTNFPGPGNNDFTTFDVHRAYINLFYSPTDHVTLRITPNIYREAITGSADKAGAVGAIAASADGNLTFRLKYGYLEFGKLFENSTHFKNTNLRFGQTMNPLVDWEEALWDYRFLSLVPWNYLSLSSTQVGASLNGPITGKNGRTYLDYQVGVFNDASFHAFEFSEQKQFMVRASLYPMGARTRFDGLGLTGFYEHGYTNNAPDTNAVVPVVRVAALAHYTTPSNGALIGFEYDYGKNAFNTGNMFSGDGPQDLFGIGTTVYATPTKLWQAVLAGTDTRQQGWNVFGRYTLPHSKFSVFAWDQFFKPNTNIPTDPLDFSHIVAGVAYRASSRWRVAVSDQHALYSHDQFTYPAATLATFNPALAAANPSGIPSAVPPSVHVAFLSVEFSF
jgi:hypothetical protein